MRPLKEHRGDAGVAKAATESAHLFEVAPLSSAPKMGQCLPVAAFWIPLGYVPSTSPGFSVPSKPMWCQVNDQCYKKIQSGGNSSRPLSGTDLRDSGRWCCLLLNDLFAAPPRYKAGRGGSSCLIHPSLSEDAVRAPALFLRFCFETSSSITRTAKPDAGTRRLYRKHLLQVGARSPSVRTSQVRQHGCPVSGGVSPAGGHGAVGCQGTEQPGFPCRLLILGGDVGRVLLQCGPCSRSSAGQNHGPGGEKQS